MDVDEKKAAERWMRLQLKVAEERIKTAFRLFRKHDIEPILIKGWAAARFYPERESRIFTDIDLCVEPSRFRTAQSLLAGCRGNSINIDLHNGLRHLDTLSWDDLFLNSVLLEIDGVPVRVLRPEDHLRVLCVHWLTDGGVYREKLLDIYYILKNRPDDFDWQRCLSSVDPTRRDWIIKTIAVTRRYHPLELDDCPYRSELETIPDWIIGTIESEWKDQKPLKPLQTSIRSRSEFWQQIRKRFPPNAIQATVEMEGRFDDGGRLKYQLGSMIKRIRPSLKSFYRFWRVRRRLVENQNIGK